MISGLGARVHLFVRPEYRERLHVLFRDVLGCTLNELDFGMTYPFTLVAFEDGSAFSVEFSEYANVEPDAQTLDFARAHHGAWIEFRTTDLPAVLQRLRDSGTPSFSHPASPHAYFSAPGGQVFRVLDSHYRGP